MPKLPCTPSCLKNAATLSSVRALQPTATQPSKPRSAPASVARQRSKLTGGRRSFPCLCAAPAASDAGAEADTAEEGPEDDEEEDEEEEEEEEVDVEEETSAISLEGSGPPSGAPCFCQSRASLGRIMSRWQ
mmetsp:Transcript_65293/g.184268  ORF Transcript_65293/g.184268 Transcript_65293/m.184268 type:complete len:132 (+) Transcript_65293:793-1188(+)